MLPLMLPVEDDLRAFSSRLDNSPMARAYKLGGRGVQPSRWPQLSVRLWGMIAPDGANSQGPLATYGDLWGHIGAYGDLWGPMGTFGDLLAPMGTFGDPWGSMGPPGDILGLMGT